MIQHTASFTVFPTRTQCGLKTSYELINCYADVCLLTQAFPHDMYSFSDGFSTVKFKLHFAYKFQKLRCKAGLESTTLRSGR